MTHSTSAAERWTAILEDWRRSRLSVARFCERRGLQAQSLYVWRRRLREGGEGGEGGEGSGGGFVEARVIASSSGSAGAGWWHRSGCVE